MALRLLCRIIENSVDGHGELKTSPKESSPEHLWQCVVSSDDQIWSAARARDLRGGGLYTGETAEMRFEDDTSSKARLVGPIHLVTDVEKKRAFYESRPALQRNFESHRDDDFVMLELRPDTVEIETCEVPDPFDDLIL